MPITSQTSLEWNPPVSFFLSLSHSDVPKLVFDPSDPSKGVFEKVETVSFSNSPGLEVFVYSVATSLKRISTNMGFFDSWSSLPRTVTSISFLGAFPVDELRILDLSVFPALEVFKVSHRSFCSVIRVFICNMTHLREVFIGNENFEYFGDKLIISDNPCLQSVVIGKSFWSFCDFEFKSEIEGVFGCVDNASLETISFEGDSDPSRFNNIQVFCQCPRLRSIRTKINRAKTISRMVFEGWYGCVLRL